MQIVKNPILQLFILLFLFFFSWYMLSRIDYIGILKLREKVKVSEEKIGSVIWQLIKKTENELSGEQIVAPVDSIKMKLCEKNAIRGEYIKIHIIRKDDINAFAVPGNRLIIYSGLIRYCNNPVELCGIIAHEMAHIEKKHVMNKLVKEAGLAVLASLAGGGGGETVKEIIRLLSSRAYDRGMETEADRMAVKYMINAGVDPECLAGFLIRIAQENDLPDELAFISTHPDSKERAAAILKMVKTKQFRTGTLISSQSWDQLKRAVE